MFYPGLASHPDHALAAKQQGGPGFLLAFRVLGGPAGSAAFLSKLQIPTLAASLGSFASLICRPASMTHAGMPAEAREAAGITEDLIRLSVGLEDAGQLIRDFTRALSIAND